MPGHYTPRHCFAFARAADMLLRLRLIISPFAATMPRRPTMPPFDAVNDVAARCRLHPNADARSQMPRERRADERRRREERKDMRARRGKREATRKRCARRARDECAIQLRAVNIRYGSARSAIRR